MTTFKNLLKLVTLQEHKWAGLLLTMILIMASLDMVGVAFVVPFIVVLASPEMVEINLIMKTIYQIAISLGEGSVWEFLFALVIAYGLIFNFSNSFLLKMGQDRVTAYEQRCTALSDAFSTVIPLGKRGVKSAGPF